MVYMLSFRVDRKQLHVNLNNRMLFNVPYSMVPVRPGQGPGLASYRQRHRFGSKILGRFGEIVGSIGGKF